MSNALADLLNTEHAPVADQKAALMAQLAALEAADAAKKAPPIVVPDAFRAAIDIISRACLPAEKGGAAIGRPTFAGEAAKVYCAMVGQTVPDTGTVPGVGPCGALPTPMSDVKTVIEFGENLVKAGRVKAADAADAPTPVVTAGAVQANATSAALLPADAPASNPALAAKPVEGFTSDARFTPSGAAIVETSAAPSDTPAPEGTKPKRKYTRKVKPANADGTAQTEDDRGLEIFVNAIPSRDFVPLDVYVKATCDALAKKYGLAEIRTGKGDSPCAFGAWKGLLYAAVQANPPESGAHVCINPGECAEVVIDALSTIADEFVRGVR